MDRWRSWKNGEGRVVLRTKKVELTSYSTSRFVDASCRAVNYTSTPTSKLAKNKMLSYRRETALQGTLVLAESGRLELRDNILLIL